MIYVLRFAFNTFFNLMNILLFVRALMSWFIRAENPIYNLLVTLTEPIIMPVRWVWQKFNLPDTLPIDVPYLLSFVVINILQTIVWILLG